MSLLLETIRIKDGIAENLDIHDERVTASQLAVDGLRRLDPINEILADYPPPGKGLIKARLIYNKDLFKIQYQKYVKSKISKLVLWETNSIYYPFKFANREIFDKIKKRLPAESEAIITVQGRITDTTYTNLAFKQNKHWYTPEHPILKGTQRAYLLNAKIISLADITVKDLPSFDSVRLFNAMMPWEESIELSINNIVHAKN
jgi:4-amino-4-deoxychorismate lyase